MSESRSKKTKRNIYSGIVNKMLTLGLPFIIRTILIQKLGAEYLGLGSLFTSILQVLSMAELGFSSAIVFSLYKPLAENNVDEICALMFFYRKIYKIVGLVILIVGLLLIPFLSGLIKGSYPNDINLYFLYLIYLFNTVVSYLAFAYKSVLLTASQRQDVISNIDSILAVSRSVVQIVVLFFFSNFYLYIIWNAIFTVINNVVIAIVTKRRFPEYVCKGQLERDKQKNITQQIKGIAIGKFALTARNSFDSVVLSMFCGLVTVAIYSNYYYVFNAIIGFIGILVQSMSASIGNSVQVESAEKNYFDFQRFYYLFSWLGGWCTICLFCLYQPFMKLWVGDNLTSSYGVMSLFCIYFYITQMGQVRSMYTNAAGMWWELRKFEIAEMVLNLILNFILGYFWGMIGILWATIITVLMFAIVGVTITTYKYYFKKSSVEYFTESAKYCAVTLIVAIFTNYLCSFVTEVNITSLFIKAFICLIIPNVFFLFVSMCIKQYRTYLLSIKRNIISR